MLARSLAAKVTLATLILTFLSGWVCTVAAAHSAYIVMGWDAFPVPFFAGTSQPVGSAQVNVQNGSPGYLNKISGGSNNGATGNAGIIDLDFAQPGATQVVAVAIHVTDSAGSSHSLSAQSDPALVDIVNDLNHPPLFGVATVSAFSFANAPQKYAADVAALSVGEAANGRQPFDLLLAINNNGIPLELAGRLYWAFNFSGEVGQLDGITSLQVTDVAAIPEPASIGLLAIGAVGLLTRRPIGSGKK